jgi:hypothetical protein
MAGDDPFAGFPPRPDTARIGERFAPHFELCEELLRVVWAGHPPRSAAKEKVDAILLAILERSIEIYVAVLALTRDGRTLAALMLDRALFEDMVAAFWISMPEHRERGPQLIRDQEDHIVLLSNDLVRQYPHRVLVPPDEHPDLEAKREEYEKRFGRYGSKTWFGDIHPALQEIGPRWEELGGSVETLRVYYAFVQRHIKLLIHNTANSVMRSMERYDNPQQIDDSEIDLALRSASYNLYGLALLVFTELGVNVRRLNEVGPRMERVFLELGPRRRARIGRNDPCWCGSGKKLKKCHGM